MAYVNKLTRDLHVTLETEVIVEDDEDAREHGEAAGRALAAAAEGFYRGYAEEGDDE